MSEHQPYVKTDTILDKILAHKVDEIAFEKSRLTEAVARKKAELAVDEARAPRDFIGHLRAGDSVALIAEVKKASPSKGILVEDFDAERIGKIYADHGASAISVLTDEHFFQGHLGYMGIVRKAVNVPVLRKDFIIDPYQVYVARGFTADAVLLIVAALSDSQLKDLHDLITSLGMAALVEVHDEHEMERALKIGARLIGINNRDLHTFNVDMATTERVGAQVRMSDEITLVAESGIFTAGDVQRMARAGAQAILVGESLVKSADIGAKVRELSQVPRK